MHQILFYKFQSVWKQAHMPELHLNNYPIMNVEMVMNICLHISDDLPMRGTLFKKRRIH